MNQIEQIVIESLSKMLPEGCTLLPDTKIFANMDSISIVEFLLTVEDMLKFHFDWYKVNSQITLQELIALISEGR